MPENDTHKDIKQFITWGLLLLCCFLLAAILLFLYKNNKIGRYAMHAEGATFYVLDTKTSHVWYRNRSYCYDFGTLWKPTFEIINIPAPIDFSDLGATREITEEP